MSYPNRSTMPPPPPRPPGPASHAIASRPWYLHKRFYVLAVFAILVVGAAASGASDDEPEPAAASVVVTTTTDAPTSSTAAPTTTPPTTTPPTTTVAPPPTTEAPEFEIDEGEIQVLAIEMTWSSSWSGMSSDEQDTLCLLWGFDPDMLIEQYEVGWGEQLTPEGRGALVAAVNDSCQ